MWHTVKRTAIAGLHPQSIISLAGDMVRVLLSPHEGELLAQRLMGRK